MHYDRTPEYNRTMTNDDRRENIAKLREACDFMIEKFGEILVKTDGDEDEALYILANTMIVGPPLSHEAMAMMIAFNIRRLWHHRSRLVRSYN